MLPRMKFDPRGAGARSLLQIVLCLVVGCSSLQSGPRAKTHGADSSQATTVYSRTRNGYVRARNPDGSFQPESYVLKAGTRGTSGESRSYDRLSLDDISRAVAQPLAIQNYMPSDDPDATDLLILVYWGVTLVPDDVNPLGNRASLQMQRDFEYESHGDTVDLGPGVTNALGPDTSKWATYPLDVKAEALKDAETDSTNAAILGYADALLGRQPRDRSIDALMAELEEHRYYVVLLAYDYRTARTQGRHKLLWETRFSLAERGNDFEKALPAMALIAARFYGQDSPGLIHNDLKEGHVEIGEPRPIDTVP